MPEPPRVTITKGYRVDLAGMIAFVAAETASKAKHQCIREMKDAGWLLPANAFRVIDRCTRWPDGDGLAAKCHRLEDGGWLGRA